MRNHIGILESVSTGPDARFLETDWTIGSLPAGWIEDSGVPTYSGSGAYTTDVTDSGGVFWRHDLTTADYTNVTLMVGYDVTAWSNIDSALSVAGVPSNDASLQYFPTASTSDHFYYDLGDASQFDEIATGGATGVVIFAATMTAGGTFKLYRLTTGSDTIQSQSLAAPGPSTVSWIEVGLTPYDFANSVDGVSGDIKLAHTYWDLDAALDQTAIEAKATSWGWTP